MTNTNIRNALKSKYSTVGVFLMSLNWKTLRNAIYSHWEEQKRVDASQLLKIFFKYQNPKAKVFTGKQKQV